MFLKELIEAAETLVEDVKDELQAIIDETNAPDSDANTRRMDAVDIFDQIIWPEESDLSPFAETDVAYQLKATPPRSRKARIQSAISMLEVANSAVDDLGGDNAVDLCPMLDGIKDQLEEADVPG
jgi:hypothetical protein